MNSRQEISDVSNGVGFRLYLGGPKETHDMKSLDESFAEKYNVLNLALKEKVILLKGAKGSGKSEFLDSLMEDCKNNDLSCFKLSVHINGGKSEGVDNIINYLEEYIDYTAQYAGIILLDNCDFIGYRGKRSRIAAEKYSQDFLGLIRELNDPWVRNNNLIIATSGNDQWIDEQWRWPKGSLIYKNASQVLKMFEHRHQFMGKISNSHFMEILTSRLFDKYVSLDDSVDLDSVNRRARYLAGQVLLEADGRGLADFKHARYVNLGLIEVGDFETAFESLSS